jgi:hypothetical protein
MYYFHGSPTLFKRLDPTQATGYIKTIHLTPHIQLAKLFAFKEPVQEHAYIYTVRIPGDDIPYHKGAMNLQYAQIPEDLEIVRVDKIYRDPDTASYQVTGFTTE